MAGSFASTRSSFAAASGVPSATLTCPAWIDRPIPTPPPWWIDTHVAPEAVLVKAFSRGQSAMASEPSSIASVSRYGDAPREGERPLVAALARLVADRVAVVEHLGAGVQETDHRLDVPRHRRPRPVGELLGLGGGVLVPVLDGDPQRQVRA